MNMFARFDEIPAMTLQDIKEIKRYGPTHAWKDGQHENSITSTNKMGGIKMLCLYLVQHILHQIKAQQFYTDSDLYQQSCPTENR